MNGMATTLNHRGIKCEGLKYEYDPKFSLKYKQTNYLIAKQQ